MTYQVQTQVVTASSVAVIKDRSTTADLPKKIPPLCGRVWEFIKKSNLKSSGRMITVYHFDPTAKPDSSSSMEIEVGAQVDAPFTGAGEIVCSSTPGGTVATTVHIGPYNQLGKAHDAVSAWCKQTGHRLAGTCWELYDHPTDDETKLRKDVLYLVK